MVTVKWNFFLNKLGSYNYKYIYIYIYFDVLGIEYVKRNIVLMGVLDRVIFNFFNVEVIM